MAIAFFTIIILWTIQSIVISAVKKYTLTKEDVQIIFRQELNRKKVEPEKPDQTRYTFNYFNQNDNN